jgi:hypothetical protein
MQNVQVPQGTSPPDGDTVTDTNALDPFAYGDDFTGGFMA